MHRNTTIGLSIILLLFGLLLTMDSDPDFVGAGLIFVAFGFVGLARVLGWFGRTGRF